MRHAIQYALTYPERHPSNLPPLDLAKLASLNFEQPDVDRFPCIALAYRALRTGGTLPAALNAANEEAVNAFIDESIAFSDIPRVIEDVMNRHQTSAVTDLEAVLEADRTARAMAHTVIARLASDAQVSAA
jgi:1-deoxy-D-xylulose-5-phosphate reductoisomerase